MDVFITVDAEVWPVHPGRWPHEPLSASNACERELDAYFHGSTAIGPYGLPYQLETLDRHALKATFFVDPLFSFALGLGTLKAVVSMIEDHGQSVGLHLHPEWLTDPRCKGLPRFRGPILSAYSVVDQARLVEIGWARLVEAGAHPVPAFRAGSWGADLPTLHVLQNLGIRVDSSLNAHQEVSFPSFARREQVQEPVTIEGVVELPLSRFRDALTRGGKPLSCVGVSAQEIEFVLNDAWQSGRTAAVIVLHSNEFVRTERLWADRTPDVRRVIVRRFERLCRFLEKERPRFVTKGVHECLARSDTDRSPEVIPESSIVRTIPRLAGQIVSRWY